MWTALADHAMAAMLGGMNRQVILCLGYGLGSELNCDYIRIKICNINFFISPRKAEYLKKDWKFGFLIPDSIQIHHKKMYF